MNWINDIDIFNKPFQSIEEIEQQFGTKELIVEKGEPRKLTIFADPNAGQVFSTKDLALFEKQIKQFIKPGRTIEVDDLVGTTFINPKKFKLEIKEKGELSVVSIKNLRNKKTMTVSLKQIVNKINSDSITLENFKLRRLELMLLAHFAAVGVTSAIIMFIEIIRRLKKK